ncbi:hypothetical protein ACLBW8_00830 [Pseudomonas sp. M5A4_2d]
MTILTLRNLPEVFLIFEAVKAKKGKVVYNNKNLDCGLSDLEIISRYNYVTIDTAHQSDDFLDKKLFFAERYGGDGISTNGGGGRCGFDGAFQLKGLGPNQLVGDRPRDTYGNSHANGFLSLDVAIYEYIWAEIINVALPYGAVRSVAVIDLELDFEEPDQKLRRGLLVRLPAVRPAHFIRALYFKEEKKGLLSEDARRVKEAMHKLVYFLPKPADNIKADTLEEKLCAGIVELARRYAEQFSAAKAKRIYHQSISASNITLTGGWMDLAGSTVFSEKVLWDGFDIKYFTLEYEPAISSIQEMCFYLSKYNIIPENVSFSIFESAKEAFRTRYDKSLPKYELAQAGFPLDVLEEISSDALFVEASKEFNKILAYDDFSLSEVLCDGWSGYEYGVCNLYKKLLMGNVYLNKDISGLASDEVQKKDSISRAYNYLVNIALNAAAPLGVTRKSLVKLMVINILRLNRCNASIIDLKDKINNIRQSDKGNEARLLYGELYEDVNCSVYMAYQHSSNLSTLFWKDVSSEIYYNAIKDNFVVYEKGMSSPVSGTLSELEENFLSLKKAVFFYKDVMEFLYE